MRFPQRDHVTALYLFARISPALNKYAVTGAGLVVERRERRGHGGTRDGVEGEEVVAEEERGAEGEEGDAGGGFEGTGAQRIAGRWGWFGRGLL